MSIVLCENPLLNEPGVLENNDVIEKYNYLVTYKNIEFSICKIINYIQNYTIDANISTVNNTNKDDIAIMYKFKNIIYETFVNNKNNIIEYLNVNKIKYVKFIDETEKNEKGEITICKRKKFFIAMYNLTFYLEYEKLYNLVLQINIEY